MEELDTGDLVKWVVDYKVFEATDDGDLFPVEAIWAYGIIIEVSKNDKNVVAVIRLDTKSHEILHIIHDGFLIVSKA